jgi:hypothetical protein
MVQQSQKVVMLLMTSQHIVIRPSWAGEGILLLSRTFKLTMVRKHSKCEALLTSNFLFKTATLQTLKVADYKNKLEMRNYWKYLLTID